MDNKEKVDAYNKLLHAVLDYIQGKDIIDYKQSRMIIKYCTQNDESKKKVKIKTVKKILNVIDKKSQKRYIDIPEYSELKDCKGSRLKFEGDYFAVKQIHDMLEERVRRGKSGIRNNIYDFVRSLIDDVKSKNDILRTEQEQQKSEKGIRENEPVVKNILNAKNSNYTNNSIGVFRPIQPVYEQQENYELKRSVEERNVNDFKEVETIMLREEEAFDKALKEENINIFNLGQSYTMGERNRKEYLKGILDVSIRQKYLTENCKKFNRHAAVYMIRDAEK